MARVKSIKQVLGSFLRKAGLEERYEENLAIAFWDGAVGKEIARHTEPQKVSQGIVFVKVDTDVWRSELVYFKNEIIQRLNKKIGKKIIQEIKFY